MVRDAAKACGYQINLVARSLRIQRTETILALVPEIDNRFYPAIIKGMEESAYALGYSMVLGLSRDSPERATVYLEIINSRRVDGLIIFHSELGGIADSRPGLKIPAVQVLESVSGEIIPAVRVDEIHVAGLAVRHLASLGHRRIAHISGADRSIVAHERIRGFHLTVEAAGCDPDPSLVVQGEYTFESGFQAMELLVKRSKLPTAVFCANDNTALGAIKACRSLGLSVPGDMSVVGVDDVHEAAQCDPPLTTIRQPRHDIGANAAELLIAQIEGTGLKSRDIVMPVELIVRASTSAPHRGI